MDNRVRWSNDSDKELTDYTTYHLREVHFVVNNHPYSKAKKEGRLGTVY